MKLFDEKDLIDLFNGDLAIGSKRTDFGTICEDCRKVSQGNVGLRQAYFYVDKAAGLQRTVRWTCGGGRKTVYEYPTKCYPYCYYHCQQRGLLPYQEKGDAVGKQS